MAQGNKQENKILLKGLMPRTLFARSLLILTLPIILTLLISIYIFFDGHWSKTASRMVVGVAAEISYLVDSVKQNQDPKFVQNLTVKSKQHFQLDLKFISGGKINEKQNIYKGRGQVIEDILSYELRTRVREPYRIIVDVEEKWTQVHVQLKEGVLIVTSPQRRLFSSSGYVFLIWMVCVSTILMIVAVLFMRNQIRPIKRLSIAAERFGKGRDVPFFKPEGAREVRAAARSFMGMQARIKKQIQTRTAMLAGVSHDLRTPLTRMKLQIEMLSESTDRDALKSDVADMQRMIDAYLQFAKGDGDEEMVRTDIYEMLKRQQLIFERDGLKIELAVSPENSYEMFARPVALERCLGNIISNAQKYAGNCWVSLERHEDAIILVFDDNGPGIDEGNYEDVFRPFYREEKSRNAKTGGVGLGLPIAQDIILVHGGSISLGKSPQGGLRVAVELPI